MQQFIAQLSKQIKSRRSGRGLAVQAVIALSFVAIALGFLVANSSSMTKAFTLILPPVGDVGLIHLVSPSFEEVYGGQTVETPRKFLALDVVHVKWKLDKVDDHGVSLSYAPGWQVEVYKYKMETQDMQLVATVPAEAVPGSYTGVYDWFIPVDDVSLTTDPNPYDRKIVLRLVKPDGNVGGLSASKSFTILLWDITYPKSASLTYGSMVNITWATNLTGQANLYLETWKAGSNRSHYPIVSSFDGMGSKTMQWKVGYAKGSGSTWYPITDVLGDPAYAQRLYLVPLDVDKPDNYYKGFDDDSDFTDDWQPVFNIVAQVASRVDLVPATVTLSAGDSQQFVAKAYDASNNLITQDPRDFVWEQANASGVFSQTVAGTYTVKASYGSKFNTAIAIVTAAEAADVKVDVVGTTSLPPQCIVSKDPWTVRVGCELGFAALITDKFGNPILPGNKEIAWSGTTDIYSGLFKEDRAGSYKVFANYKGIQSNTVNVLVVEDQGAINITQPTAESVVVEGQKYFIDWQFTELPGLANRAGKVKYYYVMQTGALVDQFIAEESITVSSDLSHVYSYPWIVDTGNIALPHTFFVKVEYVPTNDAGSTISDNSVNFLIEPLSALGTIEVINPAAGDILLNNQSTPVNIRWKFSALPDPKYRTGAVLYRLVMENIAEGNDSPIGQDIEEGVTVNSDINTIYESPWTVSITGVVLPVNVRVKIIYDPDLPITENVYGLSGEFTIKNPDPYVVRPFSATYFSAILPLYSDNPNLPLSTLDTLRAVFSKPQGSNITFGLKFYDGAGNLLGSNDHDPAYPNGLYGLTLDGTSVTLDYFANYAWFPQIRQIQVVVTMQTDDSNEPSKLPWISSINLDYSMVQQTIGSINFDPADVLSKDIVKNGSAFFDLIATPDIELADSPNVVLDLTWTGTAPVGITPAIGPSILYGFATGQSYPFQVTFAADATVVNGSYPFRINGHDQSNSSRALNPSTIGTLNVTGGTTTGDFSLEFVNGNSKTVRQGNSTTYLILVKSLNGFTSPVTLTSNIASQFTPATAVSGQFSPSTPITPTPEGYQVIFAVGVQAGTGDQTNTFTITGTAGSLNHIMNDGSLTISENAPEQPGITIDATVTMEGTRGTDQPQFFFRLYPHDATSRAAKVFQKTGILPSEFVGDVVSIDVPNGLVTAGEQYSGYLRSTRHLWKKSTSTIDINAATTTYSMAFGSATSPMPAGNIGPTPEASSFLDDDEINSLDYTTIFQEWVGVWTTKFADFNNDGVVNASDITYILGLGKWGQRGDLFNLTS